MLYRVPQQILPNIPRLCWGFLSWGPYAVDQRNSPLAMYVKSRGMTFRFYFPGQYEHFRNRESVFKEYQPYFEHAGGNLSAVTGQSVQLPCGVRNLGDRYVKL